MLGERQIAGLNLSEPRGGRAPDFLTCFVIPDGKGLGGAVAKGSPLFVSDDCSKIHLRD